MDASKIRIDRAMDVEFLSNYIRSEGIRMAFFDPVSRLMDGNENDKEVVARVLNPLGDLANETGAVIQIVHHLRKQDSELRDPLIDRVRGSTDFVSWFVTALLFEGRVRDGRVRTELHQRVAGNLPNEFSIDVIETPESALGDLTSMRLRANLEGESSGSDKNRQQYLENCADDILLVLDAQPDRWATKSEIRAITGLSHEIINAASKRLIVDRGVVRIDRTPAELFEKICLRMIGPLNLSQARQDRNVVDAFSDAREPDSVNDQQASFDFPTPDDDITPADIDDMYNRAASLQEPQQPQKIWPAQDWPDVPDSDDLAF
jgi:hypothetical protein